MPVILVTFKSDALPPLATPCVKHRLSFGTANAFDIATPGVQSLYLRRLSVQIGRLQNSAIAPHEIDAKAALKQLAIIICKGSALDPICTPYKHLEKRAWALLLDLDTAAHQELLVVEDRACSNRLAAEQACQDLREQLRPAEAAELQQLLVQWQRITHYTPWVPEDPQDLTPIPDPAPLTEHQAIVSLLFALRGSCPALPLCLTALPALGSSAIAKLQQRAEAAVTAASDTPLPPPTAEDVGSDALLLKHLAQKAQAAASNSSDWIPAAFPATQLLQQVTLDPALSLVKTAAAADDICRHDQNGCSAKGASGNAVCKITSLVDGLAAEVRLSSQPYQGLHKSLGDSGQGRLNLADPKRAQPKHVSKPQGVSSIARCEPASSFEVSKAAADAEAAVAAAAAMKPGVMPLMLLSAEQPGSGEFVLLGKSSNISATATAKVLDMLSCFQASEEGQQQQQQQQVMKGAAQDALRHEKSAAALQVAAEEELIATACLALQGVWSAVGRLWDLAQQSISGTGKSSRPVGFARPASSQHLLVKVLHMAELRLRLQAFLMHFQHTSTASSTSTDASVLHAFLIAVKGVLDMHDAAIQALQHEQQQRQQQLRQAASKMGRTDVQPPAMTLLQLVVLLRNMKMQLQQLAECCWCTVGTPAAIGCSFDPAECSTNSTSTMWRLKQEKSYVFSTCYARSAVDKRHAADRINHLNWQPHFNEAAAAEARAAAAAARAAALPWPAASAAWVRFWDWDPSRWQVQQGYMQGRALAEHLYAGLLHAGPQSAPLLRHLFAAAVQPLLHQLYTWAFQPDIHAAEASAAAAAMTSITAAGRPRSARRSSSKGARTSSTMHIQDAAQPLTLAAAAAGSAHATQSSATVDARPTAGNAATDTAASELLLQAWLTAQGQTPECPSFLAGVQQQVAVAGLQLQLLQLLGGAGQLLAQRLGWLAELEQQELREVLGSDSSSSSRDEQQPNIRQKSLSYVSNASLSPTRLQMHSGGVVDNRPGGNSCSRLALLLGGRGGALAAGAVATAGGESAVAVTDAGAAYLPFNLSISQLKQAAAVVADYEDARQSELSTLMGSLSGAKAAAAEAEKAQAATRLQEKAAAEETRQQLQQAAAARKVERKRQLLLEQQEMMAAAAARRAKSRRDELAFERSLLAQAAAADHKAAVQQVQRELAAAQKLGLQLQLPALQQQDLNSSCDDSHGIVAAAAGPLAVTEVPQVVPAVAATAVADTVQPLSNPVVVEQQQESGHAVSGPDVPTQQQQEQHQNGESGPKRSTWGPAVFDPTPAAGRPSAGGAAAAAPLAVVGSAAAAAADMPAAGRRSNSTPRVWGSVLNPEKPRPGSSGSAGSSGWGCRRTSGTGGQNPAGVLEALQNPSNVSFGTTATGAAGHKKAVVQGKWGMPVVPGPAAGVSSRQRRPSSAAAAGSSGAGSLVWQQGSRAPRHSRGHSAESVPSVANGLSTDDVLIELMVDDGANSITAAAAGDTSQATKVGRQRQQQQEDGNFDSRRATAADRAQNLSGGVLRCDWSGIHHNQQQQQPMESAGSQIDATCSTSAPLITTLEVLVVRPLLAQHRLTTLACWQLLLQEQHLLQKLAAMQAVFFQQQADWVDLFVEGLDSLISPAGDPYNSRVLGSSSGRVTVEKAGVVGAAAVSQHSVSHVAAQLVLEAALQQSCLAGEVVAERLTVQVDCNRCLPGWGHCRSRTAHTAPVTAHTASATDALMLHYDVPWPVSLLVSQEQQQRYSQIFSVLLRLRRLQQQLTKQWVALNSRSGSSNNSNRAQPANATGVAGSRETSRAASRCISRAGSLTHKQQQQQSGEQGRPESDHPVSGAAAVAAGLQGLDRLQQLRRWHAMALHCVSSLLATMLSELSGSLWGAFESAVAAQPVSLPAIIEAHARLLAAAQEVCLLPQGSGSSGAGSCAHNSSDAAPGVTALVYGTSVAQVVYQLTDAAWLLQQQVQQLLECCTGHPAAAASSLSEVAPELLQPAAEGLQPAGGSNAVRESSSSRALASMLAQDEGSDRWHGVQMAGGELEGLLKTLRFQLESNRACGVGEALAGLAARLGVYS